MYKHLLVATDGSKLSAKAVAHAIALAQTRGGKLTAFYASPDYPTPVYAEGAMGGDSRGGKEEQVRCDRDGIARSARRIGAPNVTRR